MARVVADIPCGCRLEQLGRLGWAAGGDGFVAPFRWVVAQYSRARDIALP